MKRRERGVTLTDLQQTCCHPDCHSEPLPDSPVPLCVSHVAAVARYFMALAGAHKREALDLWIAEMRPEVAIAAAHHAVTIDTAEQVEVRSVCYFIVFGDRLKIGTTTDLRRRMHSLPHDELIGTVPGGPLVERDLHRRFRAWHVSGEWFHATSDSLAEVDRILGT